MTTDQTIEPTTQETTIESKIETKAVPTNTASEDATTAAVSAEKTNTAVTDSETSEVKNDQIAEIDPKLSEAILKQVHFYFSDSNLARDEFLRTEIRKDSDGWMSLAILASFNRMKSLTEDLNAIAQALRSSDVVEVSEDGRKLRRRAFFKLWDVDMTGRVLFVDDLPAESTLDEIITFFEELADVSLVNCINKDGKFTGSAWVEFASREGAQKVLGMTDIKFQDKPLKMITRESKIESMIESGVLKSEKGSVIFVKIDGRPEKSFFTVRDFFRSHGTVANVDITEKTDSSIAGFVRFSAPVANSVAEKLATTEIAGFPATVKAIEGDEERQYWIRSYAKAPSQSSKNRRKSNEKKKVSSPDSTAKKYDKNCILKFTVSEEHKNTISKDVTTLKEAFSSLGEPRFVDFKDEEAIGFVRFKTPIDTEKLASEMAVNDVKVTVEMLQGDDEDKYWNENVLPNSTNKKRGRGGNYSRHAKKARTD